MRGLFGTDGIRGRALEPPLDEDTVRRLGAALAGELARSQDPPHLLLAGDTRASTEVLARWLASAYQGTGGRVTWAGVLPTPAVSHILRSGRYAAGVVISASHNPAEDNGIKVIGPTGEKLEGSAERHLEEQLARSRPASGPDLPHPDTSLQDRYLELLGATHTEARPLSGVHVVVDTANGAASAISGPFLESLGARVTAIAASPDGTNINDGCGATAPDLLAATVRRLGADCGLALDGDADRAVCVDEGGQVLDGDDILLVWGRHLAETDRLPGRRVVATVMSNYGLERALHDADMVITRCPVGDRSVWLSMQEHRATLGGEQSGHVICSHHTVSGDGLVTGSHMLAIAAACGRRVSELSNLQRMPQTLVNVPVRSKLPFDQLPRLQLQLASTQERLDGRGRVLLRYSGTEAVARVMVEGDDALEIESLASQLAETIRTELQ